MKLWDPVRLPISLTGDRDLAVGLIALAMAKPEWPAILARNIASAAACAASAGRRGGG